MSSEKTLFNIPGVIAPLAVAVGLVVSAGAMAGSHGGDRYWKSPANEGIMTGYGECWKAVGGSDNLADCGAKAPMDSDGDGVPDDQDKCPNTPRGVKVDADGCPLDSDGDGVPDYRDKCPDTPKGDKVDEVGCTIIGDITIDLVNDEFDFDSAKLKPDMKSALMDVANKIKASPGDEYLSIIGHTDSIGSENYNMGLSERRAASVKAYLVEQGLDAGKISTQGRGESQPVADNKTKAGRSKNRRVEIMTK
jgi:OOP family OmpA-OmpF porin